MRLCLEPVPVRMTPGRKESVVKRTAIVLLVLLSTAQAASSLFSGKILVIYTKGDGLYYPRTVSHCNLSELGGQRFIVGRIVKCTEDVYDAGKMIWIALDSVSQIIEYDNEDDVRKAMAAAQKSAQQYYQSFGGATGRGGR